MKKILCTLLAVLMMALPFSGMAMTTEEIAMNAIANGQSVTVLGNVALSEDLNMFASLAGDNADQVTAVMELLNSLVFGCTLQSNMLSEQYYINGGEALSFTLEGAEDALYIGSNLLEKPIIIDQTELTALYEKVIAPMIQQLDEQTDGQVSKIIEQLTSGDLMNQMMGQLSDVTVENTMAAIMNIAAKAVAADPADVAELPCDPAEEGVVVTVTAADSAEILKALAADLQASGNLLDTLAQAGAEGLDQMLIAAADEIAAQDITVTVSVYTNNGNLVAMDVAAAVNADGDSVVCEFVDCVAHGDSDARENTIVFSLSQNDQEVFTVSVFATESYDADSTKMTAVVAQLDLAGQEMGTLSVSVSENTADLPYGLTAATLSIPAANASLDIDSNYATTEQNGFYDITESCSIKLSVGEIELNLGTINAEVITGEAMPSIAVADAARLLSVDEAALSAWAEGAMNFAMSKLMGVIELLPESLQAMVQ